METTDPAVSTYGAGSAALTSRLTVQPMIEQYTRTDVTIYFTRAEKMLKYNTGVVLDARSYYPVYT